MGDKVRFLDKSKRCNRRCSSCQFWMSFKDSITGSLKHCCLNTESIHFNELRNYWHICKEFTWADNIIDKNDLECPHCIVHPDDSDALCFYYSRVNRKDKLAWVYFPKCIDKNCPIKHPELLQGEVHIKLKDEV